MPETLQPASRPLELTEVLTLLLEATERINSTLDLDELMVRIAETVKRAIDYDIFAILLLNEKTRELRIRFSQGHPEKIVNSLRVKLGEGIVGRAAELKKTVLLNDVRNDPSYIESLAAMRSELAVPLIVKGRVVGVMDLEAAAPDFFTEQHQNLLELLASRIASAIENARLYRRSVRQAKTLALLYDISRELSSVLVLEELLRKIGTLVKRLIDYHRFGIMLANERTGTFDAVISLRRDERMPDKCSLGRGEGIVGAAAASRKTIVVGDVQKDPRYVKSNPETRSELVVPLEYGGKVIGVVDLESPQLNYFTEEHVRILSTLAPQMAVSIENARLYERVARSEARLENDLERAREIQRHLMPAPNPAIPGLEIAVRFFPARELGGDLYDFLAYGRDRHVIAIGDVSGKGAPAALFGAMAGGILRSLTPEKLPPPEMLRKLNRVLLERQIDSHFITLAFSVWEPKTKTLRLANAGMPLPILVRGGRTKAIRVEGVPLGLLANVDYQETALALERGDLLALFSDGVSEATNPAHEEFGNRRLEGLLAASAARPLPEIADWLFAEIGRFEDGRPRRDDQTLVLVRVR
ncbi:MAG: serine/threonine protein phosphatase [Acidobacteria bacterium]|nr:MAG: serine/threonine protein phosphatase [Acidobacteriota bacterium]